MTHSDRIFLEGPDAEKAKKRARIELFTDSRLPEKDVSQGGYDVSTTDLDTDIFGDQPAAKESSPVTSDSGDEWRPQLVQRKAAFKNGSGSKVADVSIRQPTVIGRSRNLSSPPKSIRSRNPFRTSGKQAKKLVLRS